MCEQVASTDRQASAEPVNGRNLRRTVVRDVMTTQVVSVHPEMVFEDVARTVRSHQVRAVPVLTGDGQLVGVISEHDLMRTARLGDPLRQPPGGRWHRGGGAWTRARTADDLMSRSVTSVTSTASVAEAARLMYERKLGWLAVVEDGQLVGVLGPSDVLSVFSREDDDLRGEIEESLRTRLGLADPSRVQVSVDRGVVTLSGHLATLAEARLVTEFVERLEGTVAVIHGLTFDVEMPKEPVPHAPPQWIY